MQELKDKVSYAVGLSIAESLKSQQLGSLDLNFLKDGIQDVFEQKERDSCSASSWHALFSIVATVFIDWPSP